MKRFFSIDSTGISEIDSDNGNVVIITDVSKQDEQTFIEKYHMPKDVFEFDDIAPIAPRIEQITNEVLGETLIFVLANVTDVAEKTSVEDRLESHTFILSKKKLFWFVRGDPSQLHNELFTKHKDQFKTLECVIIYAGLLSYSNFAAELIKQKEIIDELNESARHTSENQVLINASETERNMVLLEHTIGSQEESFTELLLNEKFITRLNNEKLVYDIKWYNRRVKKLVTVYRDLLDTVSGLFSDIMSSNLNKLLKFLNRIAISLAVATLIAGLWGMNTGGLPGKEHEYGTLIMSVIALSTGILTYIFLRYKKFY